MNFLLKFVNIGFLTNSLVFEVLEEKQIAGQVQR